MSEKTAKCGCQACGNHIEFPLELAGQEIPCPHCGAAALLQLSAAAQTPVTEPVMGMSVEEVLAGFTGTITRSSVSAFYQLGLALVALTMAILPVVYVAMIGAAGYGVYWYAIHASFLVGRGGGFQIMLVEVMAYFAPLFAGVVIVLFMIKPLFARRPPQARPLALNPEVERTLFAFIAKICEIVGAPMPTRIDLDCQLNASARFRRGASSAMGKADLALTIGLPLVAGLNARELAGVIAHEFGHFTQGCGMRLSYFVRVINGWFARVVFERDTWDVSLEQAQAGCRDWRLSLVIGAARLGVWFSRLVLKGLMYTGHGVCCFLLRQMEYDADSYEIKVAGSAAFESAMLRMQVLAAATVAAYKEMRISWNNARVLADDLPQYMLHHETKLPQNKKDTITGASGLARTKLFDTHPSVGDRIRKARQAGEPGVFNLEFPASGLFGDFSAISKQVTRLHYAEDLRIPLAAAKLRPLAMAGPETAGQTGANAPLPPEPRKIPLPTKSS